VPCCHCRSWWTHWFRRYRPSSTCCLSALSSGSSSASWASTSSAASTDAVSTPMTTCYRTRSSTTSRNASWWPRSTTRGTFPTSHSTTCSSDTSHCCRLYVLDYLTVSRLSKLWIPFLNHLLDGVLCQNLFDFRVLSFFLASSMSLSHALTLPMSQLQTQQLTISQIRSHIEY